MQWLIIFSRCFWKWVMNDFLKSCRFTKFLNFNLQDGLWSKCCKQPKIRGRQCYFSNWGFGPKCSSGRTQCVIFIEIIFSRASRFVCNLLDYQNYDNSFSGFFIQFLAIFQTQCAPTNCTKNFWRLPELRKIWDWVQWDK